MAAFGSGNLVVYRVGTGAAALTNASTAVFLDEYTAGGVLVQSIALPTADNGSNQTLTAIGNSALEGLLTRSVDGRYLVMTGYDTAVATANAATLATSTNRVIGRVGVDGTIDTSTSLALGAGNVRGIASDTGTSFYVSTSTTGVSYGTFGSSTVTQLNTSATGPTNVRGLSIYAGQLYESSMSGTFRIATVGSGEPTTAPQTVTNIAGDASATSPNATAAAPGAFFFADLTTTVAGVDTLYVADSRTGGGLFKYSLTNGTWQSSGSIADTGLTGLTGSINGGNVTLFGTTGSALDLFNDTTGYGGILTGGSTRLATAGTSTAFRGVAFAPQAEVSTTETVAFQSAAVEQVEGNTGSTVYSFTLTRTGSTASASTVGYAVSAAAGTTTLTGSDFVDGVLPTGTATFAAGSSTATVTIAVAGDQLIEATEQFTLSLTAPSTGYVVSTTAGALTNTITNDDVGGTFSIAATTAATEGGAATFTVSRSDATGGPVDLTYAVTGGTADAADFANGFPTGTVHFDAGQTSAIVSVATADDSVVEGDESFTVTLSAPTAGTIGTAAATGTILANDAAGTVSVADVTVNEGDGTATITLTRTGGAGDITVSYATADGSAVAGTDYTATSGSVSFAGTATTASFTVPILNDNAVEGSESFTIVLTAGTGNPTLDRGSAVVTITDNDVPAAVGSFGIAPADQSVVEGSTGTTAISFTVTRGDGSTGTVDVPYSVAFTGTNPADAADFASGQALSGTVSFADGDTAAKTITLLVQGDSVLEANETFTVALGTPSAGSLGSQSSAIGTIVNDDSTFAIASGTGSEGGASIPLVVTRSGDLSQVATLDYAVTLGTGDTATTDDFTGGTLPTGQVRFEANAATATILVPVANDTVIEPNETFTVTLSGAGAGQAITTASATGTIQNDDVPTLSIGNASIIEGDAGTSLLTFTVTASTPAPTGGIGFQAATSNGTATAGSDYAALAGSFTIAAGETSTTVSIVVNGDTAFERNETLLVTLSNPTNATIAAGQGIGTISNDDAVPATATLFATDFAGFAAGGFAPGAAASSGLLDSNIWRVVGLSAQTNPAYGFTGAAGDDFARGLISGDPVTAGVYSLVNDRALVLQPTGAELEAGGFVEARIQNNSGATATSFDVAFDWAYRNNAGRSDNMQLAYSTDGTTFTAVPAANFATPGAADNTTANFTNQREAISINGTVADGGYLYLRWIHASSTGGGSRDEVGIDNVAVTAHLSTDPTASIGNISVAEGNDGTTAATFTITRSNGAGTASVDYATADGTAQAGRDYVAQTGSVSFAVGETSKTITVLVNGDTANEANETFVVNLTNPVGFAVPAARATATITNDDTGPIAIYDLQGLGHRSAFTGQVVTTTGIVTAVRNNGFYLQDATGDGNVGTSDAIFVATGTTAPTVSVGNAITLSGTVTEFASGTTNLTLTQLTNPTAITVTNASVALPDAVVISTDGSGRAAPTQVIDDDRLTSYDPTTDGIDFYESLEGMRVTVRAPLVVADTNANGETYVVASQGVGATGLNDRNGMTISLGDTNPETIKIYQGTSAAGAYHQGDVLNDVTGVVNYFGGEYEVDPIGGVSTSIAAPALPRETGTLVGTLSSLSYASFNVENLGPVATRVAGESDAAYAAKQAVVDARFVTHATEVVNALHNPDILGLQEIQDADGENAGSDLSGAASAQKLIDAIAAAGGPTYRYVEVAPAATNISGGAPNGNIRNGFLYNPERVSYVDGSATAIMADAYTGTRKPLAADFLFNGQSFTAIDLHSTSRGGSDPLYGANQPPTNAGDAGRTAQAAAAKAYIDGLLNADPSHQFVVNGDFNGFYYETALQTLAPVNNTGALSNLIYKLPVEERYTYYFDGYYQAFDNVIVSTGLYAGSSFDIVHYNAGYNDGLSATDHDQALALIGLARGGTAPGMAVADGFAITAASVYGGTVLANDTGGDATLSVIALNGDAAGIGQSVRLSSGALVTVTAGGVFTYNPDGAFSGVAAGATVTDSFSYTITGGSTATATVTITGLATPTPDGAGHIVGTTGNDSYGGTQGADYFDLSGGGNDRVNGGAGTDAFYLGGALTGADRIEGGSGVNQVGLDGDYTGANRLVLAATTLSDIAVLAALPGHSYDIVLNPTVTADTGAFTVYGSNLATGDAFTVDGSSVTSGSLTLYGGRGVDMLTGGAGNDGFFFGPERWGANDVVHGGAGSNDQVGLDGNYTLTLDGRMDVEVVALLAGPAGTPNSFAITVADSLVETGGVRTIFATSVVTPLTIDGSGELDGRLNIYGGQANDMITGSAGRDMIFGGNGADTLRGGAGADVFLYDTAGQSTGTGYDRLLDFDYASDTIRIAGQTHDQYAVAGGGQLNDATFDIDLQAAVGGQLNNGSAVFFTATSGDHVGQTFLVVDADGVAGYQAGGDYVFQVAAAPTVTPVPDFIIG